MRRLLVWLVGLLVPGLALAATIPNQPIFPQTPRHYLQRFVTTDVAGTYKTVVTGNATGPQAAGTRCHAIWIVSTDTTTPHLISFRISVGATPYPAPAVNTLTTQTSLPVLDAIRWPGLAPDSDGGFYLHLEPGQILEATFATSIPGGAIIAIHADCWDF